MPGIATRGIIAGMEHEHSFWNWATHGFKHFTMDTYKAIVFTYLPVAFTTVTLPLPTAVGHDFQTPE